ncbi:J domain-containing protein [Trichothermofontia sp.]
MSIKIEQGLFREDFTDHHAVLGIPIDAEAKEIRKRWLQISRRLHPDSLVGEDDVHKQVATEILSKLVNPAYELLKDDRERSEYLLLLKLKGKQAIQQQAMNQLASQVAKTLLQAKDPTKNYHEELRRLATQQYDTLDGIMAVTGQISELNLAYLMRMETQDGIKISRPIATAAPTASQAPPASGTAATAQTTPPVQTKVSISDQYYRRAEEFLAKKNYAEAIKELRDALKIEPTNARCHTLLGTVYLAQKQNTMAKIHFQQALKHNPQDSKAKEGLRQLGHAAEMGGKTATGGKTAQKSPSKSDKSAGGGLFGRLFGGKK